MLGVLVSCVHVHANLLTGPQITEVFSASVCSTMSGPVAEVGLDCARFCEIGLHWFRLSDFKSGWERFVEVGIRLDQFW